MYLVIRSFCKGQDIRTIPCHWFRDFHALILVTSIVKMFTWFSIGFVTRYFGVPIVPNLTCCDTPLKVSFLVCLFGSSPVTVSLTAAFYIPAVFVVGKKNKKKEKKLREWINKKEKTHMWHMHLNMHLTKILHALCVHFECTSKCYHNERKYCSYCSATLCCQENNNTFWKIEWLSIIFNQEIKIKKWTKWIKNTSTNYNLQMWPIEPARESLCFLRGPLEWLMVVKNVNVIYVFDWRSHVFESVVMLTTKFLLDDKITACIKQICLLGVICKVSDRKTLTNEKFCSLRNILLSIFY